jgi:methionyl-tRNA formyltransferase
MSLKASEVKNLALEKGLAVLQPAKMKDPAFAEELRLSGAKLFVVAAYGRILPESVLSIPELTLNVHASLLPRWRGASPIQHAILTGDRETGISIMRLVAELDAGDVLLSRRTPIDPGETAGELESRLADIGGEALIEALNLLGGNAVSFSPQDASKVTFARLIAAAEGRIDWTRTSTEVNRKVLAFNPSPGAFTLDGSERIKIHRTRIGAPQPLVKRPGELQARDRRLWVSCGDAWLEILELQREGKKAQSAEVFLSGYRRADQARWI